MYVQDEPDLRGSRSVSTDEERDIQIFSHPKDSAVEDKLHCVIAHQERLISRLEKIESHLITMSGDKVFPKGNNK